MPCAAIATMECWGAEGGPIINTYTHYKGGCGGYVKGTISLPSNLNLYVYVGGAGTKNGETRTFNGGGRCAATDDGCASGGGATDIRLRSGNWNDFNSLLSRIIVAGGGAGAERTNPAGAAGGLTSYTSKGGGNATQSSGYRLGYGEDAVGAYNSWFKESIIFGCIWSLWHLPLFWVPGTYQYGLKEMGIMYVINFLLSVIPLDFLQTWVYVKNNRSMLATIIFHLFINIMQEKINMTPETKCIQTIFVAIAAIIIVVIDKEMFFETKHVGNLLEEEI